MWKLPRGLEIWRYCKASIINNFKKFWVLFGSLSFIERLIALRSLFFLYLLLLLVTSTLLCIIDLSFKFLNILTSNQILFYLPTSSRGYALHFFFHFDSAHRDWPFYFSVFYFHTFLLKQFRLYNHSTTNTYKLRSPYLF